MLDKILDIAESLGNMIAQKKGQSVSVQSKPVAQAISEQQTTFSPTPVVAAPQPSHGYLFYRIKSFKDNELGTGYWQGFLKSFSDITDPLHFFIIGNNHSLGLFAKIPASIQFYFENVFYASFPTSELIAIETLPGGSVSNYIAYGEKDVIATDKDFTKDGAYLDPMKDLFSVYETVDQANSITLQFSYIFKKKEDPRKKFVDNMKKFVKMFVKKEVKKEDEKKEKPEDEPTKCGLRIGFGTTITEAQRAQ